MLLTCILIIISIAPPTYSFIPGLKRSFSANLSHRSLPFFFETNYMDSPDCSLLLLSISVFLLLSFSAFSCWFHAVD